VIGDSFYEWRVGPAKTKIPMRILLKDREAFAMAGLWDVWRKTPQSPELHSFTIVTTQANELIPHDRMPVILDEPAQRRWLDAETPTEVLQSLLQPFPARAMEAYEVSQLVNTPKNDVPACIAPVGR
jgi:putative SOS response-associated peptidase YedK